MRELTKSLFRFSWSMSLFGLEQISNLLSEKRSGNRQDRIASDFNSLTEAAEKRLAKRTSSMYESGDRLQSDMVDIVFDAFKEENWKPGKIIDWATDLVDDTADALREAVGGKNTKSTKKRKSGKKSGPSKSAKSTESGSGG